MYGAPNSGIAVVPIILPGWIFVEVIKCINTIVPVLDTVSLRRAEGRVGAWRVVTVRVQCPMNDSRCVRLCDIGVQQDTEAPK